jgi:hypothetical protein
LRKRNSNAKQTFANCEILGLESYKIDKFSAWLASTKNRKNQTLLIENGTGSQTLIAPWVTQNALSQIQRSKSRELETSYFVASTGVFWLPKFWLL